MVLEPMYLNSDPHDEAVLPWAADSRDVPRPFVATFSDHRFARIDALRVEIAAGTYRVPTAAIADALIRRMMLPHGRLLRVADQGWAPVWKRRVARSAS